jgi:outer membrane protein assembly factor BamB
VLDDSRVCAAVYQGRTGCVETLNGNALWTRDISSADGVAVDGKNLYVADTDGNLNALDKTSGATVWKQDKLAKRDLGTPILVKGRLLVGDRTGTIHALAPETGELIGRVATGNGRIVALQANGDRAIAQTDRGGVYSVSVR